MGPRSASVTRSSWPATRSDARRPPWTASIATSASPAASTVQESRSRLRKGACRMGVAVGEPGGRRTVQSFCRICTAVCGILVEVEGDRCPEGPRRPRPPALPRLHLREGPGPARSSTTTPTGSSDRCCGVDGELVPVSWDDGPRRPRRPAAGDRRRARTAGRRHLLRQRARHGRRRLPDDGGPVPCHRHAGQVQPADHRRHGEDARLAPGRGLPRLHLPHRLRPGQRSCSTSG